MLLTQKHSEQADKVHGTTSHVVSLRLSAKTCCGISTITRIFVNAFHPPIKFFSGFMESFAKH